LKGARKSRTEWEIMSNEDKVLKEVYSSFEQRLSFDDFQSKLNSLTIDKWNFVRATLLYQQYLKCKECNPNVGMVLLCSCADALQLVAEDRLSKANFMEFYLRYCPAYLRTHSPIDYYKDGKLPRATAPFEKALHFIYKQFRCLYVHKGIGHLETAPLEDTAWHTLLDRIKGEKDVYAVDLPIISEWFGQITFESLFAML